MSLIIIKIDHRCLIINHIITPNTAGGVHLPVMLFLISRDREHDFSFNTTVGIHSPCDTDPNIERGRI